MNGRHGLLREHAPALQLPVLVLLRHHRPDQAHNRSIVGKDADNAGSALDLLVEPLEQVGAPQLAPVAGREVATRQHLLPGLGHQLGRPGELAGQHRRAARH